MKFRSGDGIERLLEDGTQGAPSLETLAGVVRALRVPDKVDPKIGSIHVTAAASLAREVSAGQPAAAPVPWHRRLVVRAAQLGLVTKVLLGATLAVAATGGVAATGILPDPIQSVIADTVSRVGLDLPNPRSTTTVASVGEAGRGDGVPEEIATTTTAGFEDERDGDGPTPAEITTGPGVWIGTSCANDPISVGYTITEERHLALGDVVGNVADLEIESDRVRVRFTDGLRVELRLRGADLAVDEDRSCGSSGTSDSSSTTSTTRVEGSDTEGTPQTSTTVGDDHSGSGHDGDSTTTTEGEDHSGSGSSGGNGSDSGDDD